MTVAETEIYMSLKSHRRTEFLAGRFAGKEAFAKAQGTGIGATCNFVDIDSIPDSKGKPILKFNGILVSGFISITHTEKVAAAQVILQA